MLCRFEQGHVGGFSTHVNTVFFKAGEVLKDDILILVNVVMFCGFLDKQIC